MKPLKQTPADFAQFLQQYLDAAAEPDDTFTLEEIQQLIGQALVEYQKLHAPKGFSTLKGTH